MIFPRYTFTAPTAQNPFGNLGRDAFRAPDFFLIPDPRVNDACFGTIRSTFPPRQIQLGLKLLF